MRGPDERTGAVPGPELMGRLEGAPGQRLEGAAMPAGERLLKGLDGRYPKKLEGAGPAVERRGAPNRPRERLEDVQGSLCVQNSGPSISGQGSMEGLNVGLEPQDSSEFSASAPTGHLDFVHRDIALGALQAGAPGSCGPNTLQDFASGSLAVQAPSARRSGSQDSVPGPRVLCALRAAQMSNRQQELEVRAHRLCRRLQVIQAKQVERHVRQQLSGLVELLSERGAAGLPGSPHVELDRLACSSTARLRAAQGGFDSDATESSSGGESDAEEMVESGEDDRLEEKSPIPGSDRHAEWRWAVERASIICRWTWLQAQVSDLEFRIRQQTEIYKQIRCTKGSVVLGDSAHCEDSVRQSIGSTVQPNARGTRMPSSQTTLKTPSGVDLCDSLCNTPAPSPQSLDKQCSRLMQSVENVACQNPPTTPVCDSPGSQKTSRQVNGLINCVRSSVSCNGSTEDLDPEEVLGKKRRVDVLSASPALSDSTCVAARTRPLRGYKKRSVVRSSDVSSLSRKPQKPPTAKCGCEPPTTCILCGCKTYAKMAHNPSSLSVSERIALIDPCYHPILSFSYDTPLHLHFEALLKEDRQFRLCNKLKILKLSQLSKRAQDTGSFSHIKSEQERLSQYRVESWQRNRLMPDAAPDRMRSPYQRVSPNPAFSGSLFRDDRQYKEVSSPSIHASSPVTPRPSPAAHQLSSFTETPPSSISQQNSSSAALKRKRFENSYDIDNIVIPMSLVAASRVEKLQYKEILTPRWRTLDSAENEVLDVDPQLEDLSDEAYLSRHSLYEDVERSRWDSWTSSAPQRRGSRSSNKSDGRWTPQHPSTYSQGFQQMVSQDIRFHSLNDIPLSLSSAAADNPEPYSTVQCLSFHSRTRVLSGSEDTQSSTPEVLDEEEQNIQPWEIRFFPLSDRDCHSLQDTPETPNKSKPKLHPEVLWQISPKPGTRTESIDSGMSTENLTPASKEPPLPNSISVVRVRSHSGGDKIASLEYLPARLVNKR
ncbi:KAT8 regulatory NSL complex subunit 1-like [Hyperolius riggenbachi]|uniref:KAT8 regulatory NSL complex subunit 1-like n=1 Tax=Hyperolius riggenbachi TaxID=752182 RepID=UPI0035A34B6D